MSCSVVGCIRSTTAYSEHLDIPYGSCQSCERFFICDTQDEQHNAALLYNEGCRKHHNGGYSICIKCALKAFQKKEYRNYQAGEEHCICPWCNHDFGALRELPFTEEAVEMLQDNGCSIEGCVPLESCYGTCEVCWDFSICYRGADEADHQAALLHHHVCREDNGINSVCINCALEAFKNKGPYEEGKERCICPICDHDFGDLNTLINV